MSGEFDGEPEWTDAVAKAVTETAVDYIVVARWLALEPGKNRTSVLLADEYRAVYEHALGLKPIDSMLAHSMGVNRLPFGIDRYDLIRIATEGSTGNSLDLSLITLVAAAMDKSWMLPKVWDMLIRLVDFDWPEIDEWGLPEIGSFSRAEPYSYDLSQVGDANLYYPRLLVGVGRR